MGRGAYGLLEHMKVDARHRYEATHWAGAELRQAREIEDSLEGWRQETVP